MRRHRVQLDELAAGPAVITGRDAHHLAQVLRAAPGTPVRAFDGRGRQADGVVTAVEPGLVHVELEQPTVSDVEAELDVTVAMALLKGDKLSDVVRQCTELGATRFLPLVSRRSDVRVLSANKLERLRRVAREAAKQCGRAVLPEVEEPVPLVELGWRGVALVAQPNARLTVAAAAANLESEATVITGPEGGFAPEEVAALEERGAMPVRLGGRVLRAETAPVAVVAALLVPEAL